MEQGVGDNISNMATIKEKKEDILRYWNSKKIIVHRKMNSDLDKELGSILKWYEVEDVKEVIDLYATIIEIGVPENRQKYFWTHKWNLYEFLKRGIRKFDGHTPEDYLKQQFVPDTAEAVVFKRN